MVTKLQEFSALLPIRKHELDYELERHPSILFDVGSQMAAANARLAQAKDDLDVIESELADDIREGDPKLGSAKIMVKVNAHPRRTKSAREVMSAKREAEEWSYLYESFKARGFALKSMCDLFIANYFAPDSNTPRPELARRTYENDRDTIANARRGVSETPAQQRRRRTLD